MASSAESLPAYLLQLCTLVLVSRATGSTSTTTTSGGPDQQHASLGFTHARSTALDTLSHLLEAYLSLAATAVATAANHAGRDKGAVWDLALALAHLGFSGRAGIDELTDEALRSRDGVEEEAEQIAQLARGLQERLAPPPAQLPLAQLSYDPLHPSELDLVALAQSLPSDEAPTPSGSSGASSASDEDESIASPRSQQNELDHQPEPERQVVKTEDPHLLPSMDGLDEFGALTSDDNAFLGSLGLENGVGSHSSTGVNGHHLGVGDVEASLFQPLDLAGRPIPSLSLVGPASLSTLSLFPTGAEGAAPSSEEEQRPFPAWRDPAAIPTYVPPFFPPFPGHERESDSAAARRRRRAQAEQRERDTLAAQTATAGGGGPAGGTGAGLSRAAAALLLGGGAGGDPWEEAIPYSASSLAAMANEFGHSLPTPSSPTGRGKYAERDRANGAEQREKKRRRRRSRREDGGGGGPDGGRRSLSPPPAATTSLGAFTQIQPLIPHPPTYLRTNALRRSAAGHIAYQPRHPELSISSDSLFGSLPYAAPLRQSTLPPGFLPDLAPTAALHPFNTNLPWTISNPVPYHPASASAILPAPGPNPRVPTPLSSIARELSFPLQFDPRPSHRDQLHPNIPLFARLRRIGPPGPLGPKGEALNYDYVGNTALLALSGVDWAERRHDRKLPKRFGEDDTFSTGAEGSSAGGAAMGGGGGGGAGGGGTQGGIKLKLGGGGSTSHAAAHRGDAGGRHTREGSLAQIATPWNTFGSPTPFLGGATPSFTAATGLDAPTPVPAFIGGSTGDAELDTQLAQLSAGIASAAQPPPPPTTDPIGTANLLLMDVDSTGPGTGTGTTEQPQMDFDYPDWLLEAGGLGGSGDDGGGGGGTSAIASAPPPDTGAGGPAGTATQAGDSTRKTTTGPTAPPPASASEPPPSMGASAALDPALGDGQHGLTHDDHQTQDEVERAVEQSIAAGLFGGMPGLGGM